MNKGFLSLCFVFLGLFYNAQQDTTNIEKEAFKPPVPVELMVGNEALMFKMVVTKPINNSSFKFYNLLTFESNFIESSASNIFTQTVVFYDLSSNFSLGLGGSYSSFSNLKPIAAVLYSSFNEHRGFLVQPSIVLEKNGAKELFSMYEHSIHLSPKFKGYFRLDAFTSWQSSHSFSYLNTRIGVGTKIGNFGPAINVSFVGEDAIQFYNFGAFFNILI